MLTPKNSSVIEQVTNNTTSWIGHRPGDTNDIIRGQTFIALAEGDLDRIEVFSSMVTAPGKVQMTLYSFDAMQHNWGAPLGSASIELSNNDSGKWICFNIPGQHLHRGESYGFRLESHDALIGIGEAAGSHQQPPFNNGQEWKFTSKNQKGDSFSYFSLAFKVGVRA